MELPVVLQLISTTAIVGAVVFAGMQWRASRLQRAHTSEVLLLRSFDAPEFTQAMRLILALPDGLSKQEVESRFRNQDHLLWYWIGAMESIGILVHHREIDLRVVDDSFGGPTLLTWRKLHRYVDEVRADLKRDTMMEWYQWLAEHLEELERTEGRVAAYVRERDWKP